MTRKTKPTISSHLRRCGVPRREFLQFCTQLMVAAPWGWQSLRRRLRLKSRGRSARRSVRRSCGCIFRIARDARRHFCVLPSLTWPI